MSNQGKMLQERIVQERIIQKLAVALDLQHLEVVNESGNHNVPSGSESHFKVVLVSETFETLPLIARHRQVNGILSHELANDIHALAIHTYTGKEWRKKNGEAPMSPPCLGGGR
jgi:BolA family transcriptional regulator, general stress-responsive regulator